MSDGRTIEVRVRRFDPEHDSGARWQIYSLVATPGMTVLEGLQLLRDEQDASLNWRSSCRMGICGACGMVINGVPRLACSTQIDDVAGARLSLAPLWNLPVMRDLIVDGTAMFESHRQVTPHIVTTVTTPAAETAGEHHQLPDQLEQFLQFAGCIKCGLCTAACPTMATDLGYLGPMPLAAAQRYNSDSRDNGFGQRKHRLGELGGAFHCHYAGECSRICPKGVDPARAIQLLKRSLVADYLGLRQSRSRR